VASRWELPLTWTTYQNSLCRSFEANAPVRLYKKGGMFLYFIFTNELNGPTMLDKNSVYDPIVSSPPDEPEAGGSSSNKKQKYEESKDGN
jgi:hypothetical protein